MVALDFSSLPVVPPLPDLFDHIVSSGEAKASPGFLKPTHQPWYGLAAVAQPSARRILALQAAVVDELGAVTSQYPSAPLVRHSPDQSRAPLCPELAIISAASTQSLNYADALSGLAAAVRDVRELAQGCVMLLASAETEAQCKQLELHFRTDLRTILERKAAALAALEAARSVVAVLPRVDLSLSTIVVCGCPGAGAKTFVRRVAGGGAAALPDGSEGAEDDGSPLLLCQGQLGGARCQILGVTDPASVQRGVESGDGMHLAAAELVRHLQRAVVVLVVDVSGAGRGVHEQTSVLRGAADVLFLGRPCLLACTKTDLRDVSRADSEARDALQEFARELGAGASEDDAIPLAMSALTGAGVAEVCAAASDLLASVGTPRGVSVADSARAPASAGSLPREASWGVPSLLGPLRWLLAFARPAPAHHELSARQPLLDGGDEGAAAPESIVDVSRHVVCCCCWPRTRPAAGH